jgi:hypothetical protein
MTVTGPGERPSLAMSPLVVELDAPGALAFLGASFAGPIAELRVDPGVRRVAREAASWR